MCRTYVFGKLKRLCLTHYSSNSTHHSLAMKKRLYLLFTLLFHAGLLQAQGTISGNIRIEPNSEPAIGAAVVLLLHPDSVMVKGAVTNLNGMFEFSNLQVGTYRILATYLGYDNFYTNPITLPDASGALSYTLPDITLTQQTQNLQAVTVVYKKPIIEVLPDKLVFNVQDNIAANGVNALELLRKSPGVVVDRNNNIILQGKEGVQIYIDGKPSPLSGQDLAIWLTNLSSLQIENIEIITNPSARFDAAGNAGIINIKLKKDRRFGTNATLSTGVAYGLHLKNDNSVTWNHRNKKVNVFGNYGNNFAKNESYMRLNRLQIDTIYNQLSIMYDSPRSHNFKTGADFFAHKYHTLGAVVSGFINQSSFNSQAQTDIAPFSTKLLNSVLVAQNKTDAQRKNMAFNLNYRFADTTGRSLGFDADYAFFRNSNKTFQPNYYKTADQTQTLAQRLYQMNTATNIDIYTLKADYEQPLVKGTLSAGAKFSLVKTNNDFDFYDVLNDAAQLNPNRSNQFIYSENINAVYLNYTRKWTKWQFQAGVRAEQTNSEGKLTAQQPNNNNNVNRHYLNFFPSGGLSYQVNSKNALSLNYSRRIERPTYQDLNPFQSKLDELTYEQGNAFLRPQYTHSVSVNHTFNYVLNTSLAYNHTKDFFTQITDTTEGNRNYISQQNLGSQQTASINISYPFQLLKWWGGFANLNAYTSQYLADFGMGKIIDERIQAFSVYMQHTFTITPKTTLELSGFYNSPSIWGGTFRNQRFWGVDVGWQQKVLADRGNLKLSITDVFQSMRWRGISNFAGLFVDAIGGWESRQVRVSFSYMLGNNQLKNDSQRKTGLDDEKKRVK